MDPKLIQARHIVASGGYGWHPGKAWWTYSAPSFKSEVGDGGPDPDGWGNFVTAYIYTNGERFLAISYGCHWENQTDGAALPMSSSHKRRGASCRGITGDSCSRLDPLKRRAHGASRAAPRRQVVADPPAKGPASGSRRFTARNLPAHDERAWAPKWQEFNSLFDAMDFCEGHMRETGVLPRVLIGP